MGGGGATAYGGGDPSAAGSTNTGGGGGAYANGGSGIILIRYAKSIANVTTSGSPTYIDDGTYKIYKFTGSGSFNFPS
jgi:hypothetical protein